MSSLLSRHAECAFWMARYFERAESVARVMEVHTSFQRGRGPGDTWAWLVTLYSDEKAFAKAESAPTAENVIQFYMTNLENPGSIQSSIRLARENARALRPLIPTDMWYQVNDFYNRLLAFAPSDFTEMRLSRTCDVIKRGCYAQLGVAEATLYHDEIWPFFRLGLFIERADQMSRLLDVKFAQLATGVRKDPASFDFGFWATLLRSASAYHAFRRMHPSAVEPEDVAKFLLFDTRLPRSISHCIGEIKTMVLLLEESFGLANASRAHTQSDAILAGLVQAAGDPDLVENLHTFNDWTQLSLISLASELGHVFFGYPAPHEAAAQTQVQA
ncbi:MAG: alpha-E domain-containing protein [Chitinophagales bacterium]|nr:alpha-E domain-containing protein [Hyphomicrobiales bacterium]